MNKILRIFLTGFVFPIFLFACSTSGQSAIPTVNYATTAPNTPQVRSTPTAIPPGQAIAYKNLQVTLLQAEINSEYKTEFGAMRKPTNGGVFLWVEIALENIGNGGGKLPAPEHFSLLYGTSEFKPGYAHRQDYSDYSTLNTNLYQGQKIQAWFRFEIPASADMQNVTFAYLPDSVEISYSFPENGYDWAKHPIFLWRLP